VLALPATQGQDAPKDEKKPPSAKEQYAALVKEFNAQRQQMIPEINKAKGEEQQKLIQKYYGLGKDFAEKFYKLAEDNPKDPVAADALFWVVQNASGIPVAQKAAEKVAALAAEMPLADLLERLNTLRGGSPAIFDAALKRAEKEKSNPKAPDLIAWVATNGSSTPAGQKAAEQLFEHHPDHAAIRQVCRTLAYNPKGEEVLKQLLEKKTAKPRVKAAAALALGQSIASRAERQGDKSEAEKVAAEADKYLAQAAELAKDDATLRKDAERELNILRNLRVGKEAPDIKGADLDGKEFKLSDYRGKVVLLDFWGNW